MRIAIETESDTLDQGHEFIFANLIVDGKSIGQIELFIFDDADSDEDEYLVKFRKGDEDDDEDQDWDIIHQGHSRRS